MRDRGAPAAAMQSGAPAGQPVAPRARSGYGRRAGGETVLTWWQAVVLGLVEGITEYLPVSSTGHLILTSSLLGLDRPEIKEAVDAYLIVVQGGAILAVLGLYWPRVRRMLLGVGGRDPDGRRLLGAIGVAFVPAAFLGLAAGKHIHAWLFGDWPVLAALLAGGVWMVWLGGEPRSGRDDLFAIPWATALGIGCFQTLALWPGTSRSMVTIGGGMLLGLSTVAAAEFSFLLGLPTLSAACVHDLVGNLRSATATGAPSMIQQLGAGPLLVGVLVATVSAAVAVRWLVGFLTRHGLAPFGWYRIALALVFGGLLLAGVVGQ
jgi:undecaprenyl-diphosphatase